MTMRFTNNASADLAVPINTSATSILVQAGTGVRFPALGAGDYFFATLIDQVNNLEIVRVTARSGDTLTVVRGQDGTTARSYAAGDRIELRIVAAGLNTFAKLDAEQTFTGANTFSGNNIYSGSSTFSGVSTFGANAVFNANVGVGVASPLARVHAATSNPTRGIVQIIGNSATSGHTGSQLQFAQSGIADWVIGQPAGTNALAIWRARNPTSDGAEVIRFDSASNATLTGSLRVGNGQASSTIFMHDQDETTRLLHCNSNRIGFLNSGGGWGAWNDNNGDWGVSEESYARKLRGTWNVGASPSSPWINCQVEARSTDGSATIVSMHRNGASHFSLIHRASGELRANNNSGEWVIPWPGSSAAPGTAPVYSCRAWVRFNGSNGAIDASGNVSSVTYRSLGKYFVNFSTAMPDTNYSVACNNGTPDDSHVNWITQVNMAPETTRIGIASTNGGSANMANRSYVYCEIFR